MGIISVNTPYGEVQFKISGDSPNVEEQLKIKDALSNSKQFFPNLSQSGIETDSEDEQLFDTETGIKDAKLRASLSVAENNDEQDKILSKFGLSSLDYTRDKRNRLALTPTGAQKFGVDTDKNVLIDESGFSRYDFADFAGILPELTGAVGGALKGAAVGTAVAPGIGTLLFGALGAGLGGGGGSLAEEAIEGVTGVSDQTAKEIVKDAGKEALIAGGAELLFGAPILAFKALRPKPSILKEGDSEAVETLKKAVDMEFVPSGRQLGVSPIRAKAESLTESVLGVSPRLRANRIAMDKQVAKYKEQLNKYANQSGSETAGELFVNLSNKGLADLNRSSINSKKAIIDAMKQYSNTIAGSLKTNSKIDDELYDSFSAVFKAFDDETSEVFKNVDEVIKKDVGSVGILPIQELLDIREQIFKQYGGRKGTKETFEARMALAPNSTQNLALKFLTDSFDPDLIGKKASFSELYEVRKKLYNITTGDSRNLSPEIVADINSKGTLTRLYNDAKDAIDKVLSGTRVREFKKDIQKTPGIGASNYEAIEKAADSLVDIRDFYKEGIKEFESIASSMGSKNILSNIRSGIRPENLAGLGMNLIKNNKAQPLLNLKSALKNDDTYNTLKNELGNEWIRTNLRMSGFDSIDPKLIKPSKFVQALDELGETGDELFGKANYTKYKNIAKGFEEVSTSEINEDLITKALDLGLDQSIEGVLKTSLQLSKDLGEAQKNSVLKKIRDKNLTPDEAAKVVASPGVTVNELKYIINYLRANDPNGLNAVRKYYTEQMFDGIGATVNAKTLEQMSKNVKKFDGDFKKLNIVFDDVVKDGDKKIVKSDVADSMRDLARVLGFISKDVGNSDLVANSITANFMSAIGKIARIGIIGNLFSNKFAVEQIKNLNKSTKDLSKEKRGELMASLIGSFIRQFAAQATDTGLSSAADQTSSFIKSNLNIPDNLNQSISDLSNQINQSNLQSQNIFQSNVNPTLNQTSNIRDRASKDPSVANTLLGGLGSAGLL